MDIFSGNIFNVGRRNHRNMGLQNYVRDMEGVGYDLESPIDEPLLPGSDETDDYYNAMDALNRIGLSAAGRGIDVRNPDPTNPDAVRASRLWNQRLGDVRRAGNATAAKKMFYKDFISGRLKDGVVGGQGLDAANLQANDLQSLVNSSTAAKQLNAFVDDVNRQAKSYNTAAEADAINQDLDAKRSGVDNYYNALIQEGIPEDYAEFLVNKAKDSIGRATFNDLAERKLEGDLAAKNRRISAQNAVSRAQAEKLKKDGGDGELPGMPLVKKVISLMRGEGFDSGAAHESLKSDMSFSGWKSKDGKQPIKVVREGGETMVEISVPQDIGPNEIELRKLDASFVRDFAPISVAKQFDEAAQSMELFDEFGNLIATPKKPSGNLLFDVNNFQ